MKTVFALIVSVFVCTLSLCVQAQDGKPVVCRLDHTKTQGEPRLDIPLTLTLHGVTLREALDQLFRQAKIHYLLSMDAGRIADRVRVTGRLHNVSLQVSLLCLFRMGNSDYPELHYAVHSGRYFITSTIRLDLTDAEPLAALRALFGTIKADFVCTPQILGKGKVTLSVTDVTPEQVFRTIRQQTHSPDSLRLSCVDGIYVVHSPLRQPTYSAARTQSIFVDINEAPLSKVIGALSTAANLSVVLVDVADQTISVTATQQPFVKTLQDVLRQYMRRYPPGTEDHLSYTVDSVGVDSALYTIRWFSNDQGPE